MSETMGAPGAAAPGLGSARRRSAAQWGGRAAIATVVAGFVAGQGVAYGLIVAAGRGDASDAAAPLALLVGDLIALAVVVAVARRGAERLTPATLGIRRTRFWPALGWMLAIYFGVSAAAGIWAVIVGGAPSDRGGDASHPAPLTAVAALVAVAVVVPIVEEVAFRGYLFPALTRWRGPWIGALLTAVLFGAAHAGVYPVEFLPALAVFGFGACMLFWFTGSLLPCIALHALNNGLAVGVIFGWSWQVPLAGIGAAIATQLVLAPFARERAPQAQPEAV